jgi:hypothetical protein
MASMCSFDRCFSLIRRSFDVISPIVLGRGPCCLLTSDFPRSMQESSSWQVTQRFVMRFEQSGDHLNL